MNQKELNEIRRRYRAERNCISRIYGCYVNSAKEIVSRFDTSLGLLPHEECELYLAYIKKSLSGSLGRNLLDVEFTTDQVVNGEEHKLLQTLRQSNLADDEARETLYRKIADNLVMEDDQSYLILLSADAYDVPFKGKDDEKFSEGSEEVFRYFLCCICPVKDAAQELRYDAESKMFHSKSTGQIATPPELGFMFPTFDNRSTNIYDALYYCKKPDVTHPELLESVFGVSNLMSAGEQKDAFETALTDSLEKDCSFRVVQNVHASIRERIELHKESKDPEPLEMTAGDISGILEESGLSREKATAFREECDKQFGEDAALNPANIIDSKKFEMVTPEVKISVKPEYTSLITVKEINGRKFILVPADNGVEINGMNVNLKTKED